MARGGLGYFARQRANRVSSHVLPEFPMPTMADLAATVFHQRWRHEGPTGKMALDVLALDASHAVVIGEMVLATMLLPPFEIETNIPCAEASVDAKARILRHEPRAVFEHRQATWQQREKRQEHQSS
jgi:hypothetical protein